VTYTFEPIATLYTCFKEKFGIPRQMNLADTAPGRLVFHSDFARTDAVRHLEGFSHVWLVFIFHQNMAKGWDALVRPPRLGGNKKAGVFATRSPFRPNPIGMSAVKLVSIAHTRKGPELHLLGVDILDGTPVLDIKPYVPWADAIAGARGGFAAHPPETGLDVVFSPEARRQCRMMADHVPHLTATITQVLENDPRPGYITGSSDASGRVYGTRLFDVEVKWQVTDRTALVLSIEQSEHIASH
jgi:tRNA-Thr(GGU) m(6)t(6)A37 methyltransferase TsaA